MKIQEVNRHNKKVKQQKYRLKKKLKRMGVII